MEFRALPKRPLQVHIPEELEDKVREAIYLRRRPRPEVISEILCVGLGINPAKFGIEPRDPKAKSRPKVAV